MKSEGLANGGEKKEKEKEREKREEKRKKKGKKRVEEGLSVRGEDLTS